jgi:ubiquinone/menaquinone biosynthesis C-methylase UbiE
MTHGAGEPRDLESYEREYADSGFEVVQARLRKRMLVELLERERPQRVLEVGCGADTIANHWPPGSELVIVEPAVGFAAMARAATTSMPQVEVMEATLEQAAPALAHRTFDMVLVSGLLHEVADCDQLLDSVHRICSPGTLVHVNVPNARSIHRLLGLEMGVIEDVTQLSAMQLKLQQFRTFTLESLTELVTARNFSVVDSGSYFVKPFTHGQMEWLQKAGFLTPEMLDGLWGLARHLPAHGSEIYLNMRRGS